MLTLARRLGWTLGSDGQVTRGRHGGTFVLWDVDYGFLMDMIETDLWVQLCKDVGRRRKHMSYLSDQPLDHKMCKLSIDSQPLDSRNVLVGVLSGAYRWQDRQRGEMEDRSCPFCLEQNADRQHLWWRCPATEQARREFPEVMRWSDQLPDPIRMNGHPLLGEVERWWQAQDLANHQTWKARVASNVAAALAGPADPQVFFTDGSGRNPTEPRFRTTSWGVVEGNSPAFETICVGPTSGGRQTVPRSEIQALVTATSLHRNTTINVDASVAVRGAAVPKGKVKINRPNGDLWALYHSIRDQGFAPMVIKVKAHLTEHSSMTEDVKRVIRGNDAADDDAKRTNFERDPGCLGLRRPLRHLKRVHAFLVRCMQLVMEDQDRRVQSCRRLALPICSRFTRVLQLSCVDILERSCVRHPLRAGDGLFARTFCEWFHGLCWPTAIQPDGCGISFAELSVAFVVETRTLLPSWSRANGWVLEAAGAGALYVQLGRAVRVLCACFEFLTAEGFLPDLSVVAVQSLGRLGFKGNSGRASGLATRPDFAANDVVCSALRTTFHGGNRNRLGSLRI
jgi:hypothetical protein